jgi:hypothetical protein
LEKVLDRTLKKIQVFFRPFNGKFRWKHSSCILGGEEVAYQGRKKRKTANALYLTDKQGLALAMSTPIAGSHNDFFNIEQTFEELTTMLEDATISVDVLFLNADGGRFEASI